MKKLIEAVEALPWLSRYPDNGPVVARADVLRLIREHDPTAAIVAWLEREWDKQQRAAGIDDDALTRRNLLTRLIEDLKSGKVKL